MPGFPGFIADECAMRTIFAFQFDLDQARQPIAIDFPPVRNTRAPTKPAVANGYGCDIAALSEKVRNVICLILDHMIKGRPARDKRVAGTVSSVDEKAIPAERTDVGARTPDRNFEVEYSPKIERRPVAVILLRGAGDPLGRPQRRVEDACLE